MRIVEIDLDEKLIERKGGEEPELSMMEVRRALALFPSIRGQTCGNEIREQRVSNYFLKTATADRKPICSHGKRFFGPGF